MFPLPNKTCAILLLLTIVINCQQTTQTLHKLIIFTARHSQCIIGSTCNEFIFKKIISVYQTKLKISPGSIIVTFYHRDII